MIKKKFKKQNEEKERNNLKQTETLKQNQNK